MNFIKQLKMKKVTTLFIVLLSICTSLFAQTKPTYCDSIVAEIVATVSGTKVSFTVKTTGSIIAQSWSFGDGTSSTDLSTTHDYTRVGTFEPCITLKFKDIRNANAYCSKKICKSVTTTGTDPCADFNPKGNITMGTDGIAIFEASSSSSSSNTYTYLWNFGDNTTSTDRVGKHTYKAGTYKPCVTITSSNPKCTKTLCFEITKAGEDPCANFNPTADITVDANGLATFKGMSGTGYTNSWDFGDGTSATTVDGTHQYKPGSYKPCVTITYTSGTTKCTKTLCKEITVTEKDPCADFNPRFEYKIGENGLVTFYGGGNTTTNYTYTWSYGDGTSGTGGQSTHTYKPGTYKPCVTVYDAITKCKKTVCLEITITGTNTDPCKDFNPTFSYKIDGNVIVFEAQSGTNYTYKWQFSNSQTSTDRVVKIDFKKPGTYKGCVTITDPKTKCTKTICKEIVIKGRETEDPCKDFNPKVSFQTDGLRLKVDVDGGKGSTMEWSWGDGTKGSNDRTATHTYTKSGKYTICVTVYDAKRKCKKTICFTIEVQGKTQDPCADFKPDWSYTLSGNTITVEGSNITGAEYVWSWGDKLGDKGRVNSHTFKVAGKYTICLTIYDPKTKCTKTICKTISVGGQKLIEQDKDGKEALMVFPNPADTKISIVTQSESAAKISIKDVFGTELIRYDATPNSDKSIDMYIDALPRGTYYLNLEQDGKIESTKFVK